jgi:hypothetical protein
MQDPMQAIDVVGSGRFSRSRGLVWTDAPLSAAVRGYPRTLVPALRKLLVIQAIPAILRA